MSPASVSGTLTATLSAIAASFRPSFSMVSASVAVTSALTGPDTNSQISAIVSFRSCPDFAISEGFVVTPSTNPVSLSALISSILAVSRKSFMRSVSFDLHYYYCCVLLLWLLMTAGIHQDVTHFMDCILAQDDRKC